jgi:hypothetical protein
LNKANILWTCLEKWESEASNHWSNQCIGRTTVGVIGSCLTFLQGGLNFVKNYEYVPVESKSGRSNDENSRANSVANFGLRTKN